MKSVLYRAIVSAVFIFAFAGSAWADQNAMENFTVYNELRDNTRAKGVAITADGDFPGFKLGVSMNRITSDRPLEINNRQTIYPVYVFARISTRLTVSPYLEFGVDFGDLLIYELFQQDANDVDHENAKADDIDVYAAVGIRTAFKGPVNFGLYSKVYALYFNGSDHTSTTGSRLDNEVLVVSGVSVTVDF